ncbi:PAS-domain containing protein [Roseomonas sp. 18066]|uniref:PAS-domain containing protein n=1 Tax=Roseomonas sp. 18066 TaxID=2681412 RepID=UPI00135BED57|nr:PAS-domain containing protein [Roseomonas sp. 18066]
MSQAPPPLAPGAEAEDPAVLWLDTLQALPSPVLVIDAAGQLRLINPAMLAVLGLPPTLPLQGRPLAEVIRLLAFRGFYGPGDPEALTALVLAMDRSRLIRRSVRTTEGRWLDITSTPLPGGGWVSHAVETTDQHAEAAEAEERLRQAREALRLLPVGVGLFDAAHELLLFNEAYEQILALPPGTLRPGLPFRAIVEAILHHQQVDEAGQELFGARISLDRSVRQESLRQRADGCSIRSTSLPVAGGGFLVALEDVTTLRAAENEAMRRAALLDGVLAALPHGVCVYGADQRLAMVNAAYRRLMPESEAEPGELLRDIIRRGLDRAFVPNAADTADILYRRQFDYGSGPHKRVRRDGIVLSGRTAALPDGGHISVMSDVTALQQAEQAAQQRADLLQAMLDSLRLGVILFDRRHRVVASNALAERMTGLTRDELAPGTHLDRLRDLQYARGEFGRGPEADQIYRTRAVGAVPRLDRFSRTRFDGTVIEVSTDPTPDGGYVRIYADVTEERRGRVELERARAAAEEADMAKGRFLATMSHELRTPLNAVIGFSEALAGEAGPPHVVEFATAILEAGRHLLSLIDELLTVAQTGTGAVPVETRPLFLPSVLEGAIRLMRQQAEVASVTLTLAPIPPDLPRAQAEERRLRQVLINLVSNAVKFTPAGGSVTLQAEALPEGGVEIQVRDTGIGIDAGQVERAFEPFVQLETSHARRYGGSGLGLYLARALAQSMDATLVLDSIRGEGTVARLRLSPARRQEQTA